MIKEPEDTKASPIIRLTRTYDAPQHRAYKQKLSWVYESHLGDWSDVGTETGGIEGNLYLVCY